MSTDGIVDWASFGAVLFDLDGVVTPTAEIHERAWAELFAPWDFDGSDYLTYVDGRPRYDGVQTFLASRGVELPWGDSCRSAGRRHDLCAGQSQERDVQRRARPGGDRALSRERCG